MLFVKVALGGPLVRPVGHLGWLGGQVLWPRRLSHLESSSYQLWPVVQGVGLAGPTLGQLGLGFLPRHLPVSYYLRLPLVLDIMKICMDFGSYDAFLSSDVPEMVDQ
jgi:hypothetical protein